MERNKICLRKLEVLERNLNYKFNDIMILKQALAHSSYANENKMKIIESNERLEFLGDSILNLIVSQYLYKKYPEYPEGKLTKLRATVVCESSLAFAAKEMGLGRFLLLGKGEESSGGRERDSILADATEALTGAIYIDSDYDQTNKLLLENFEEDIVYAITNGSLFIDYKTNLQEKFQKNSKEKIEYRVLKEVGPDHDKVFHVNIIINNKVVGTGHGRNKKEAEQMAAKEGLLSLCDNNE